MGERPPSWQRLVEDDLRALAEARLLRRRRVIEPLDATHVLLDGRRLIHFCSNNYLGLTHHPAVIKAGADASARFGAGSGAAPLISGYTPAHASAEHALAKWKGTESAILFPSGYQANHAAIQTAAAIGQLAGRVRFLVDKLAHASLIDSIRGAGQPFRVFPHNHLAKLKRLLGESAPNEFQVIVTESIFSMDGDAADLPGICALKQDHDFLLIVDEAHAAGVYGPAGAGLVAELNLRDQVDVTIATLSKAMGGIGGCVCATTTFCDAMINHARAYLFSTSIPPAIAAAAEAAIGVMAAEPHRQARLRQLSRHVRTELQSHGTTIPPGDSPIIPIILGSEKAALAAAEQMAEAGLLVLPVRPPTVPRGSSRLRVTLCSEHTQEEIERLLAAVRKMGQAV